MRAAFCPEPGRFELRDVPRPAPAAGDVLLKVHNCGICGSDLHFFHGGLPCPPVCPGHEVSGEVAAVGNGVKAVHPGDRVAVEPLITCGCCPPCRVGNYQLCRELRLLGMHADGGFADFVCVAERSVFQLPAGCSWPLGALAEPTAVCVHAARLAGIRLGNRVLVLGGGTIGLLAALTARAAGAAEVLLTARHAHQREAARALGALTFAAEASAELSSYALEHPVDVVIETVGGTADTLDEALFAVRPGGAIVVLGVFTAPVALNGLILMAKEARLIGSLTYGRYGNRADFEVALDLLRQYAEPLAPLVTHTFPLGAIGEAFAVAADKHQGSIKVSIAAA